VATVVVEGQAVASVDARGRSNADVRAARGEFEQRLRAALEGVGYPAVADPERIDYLAVLAILIIFIIAATALYGPLAACLVELFPSQIRYTALSFPYHVGTGWFGGLMPAIAFSIMTATGDIYAGLWYPLMVTAASFLVMLLFLPETRGRPIR
jgi:hypothetical protein